MMRFDQEEKIPILDHISTESGFLQKTYEYNGSKRLQKRCILIFGLSLLVGLVLAGTIVGIHMCSGIHTEITEQTAGLRPVYGEKFLPSDNERKPESFSLGSWFQRDNYEADLDQANENELLDRHRREAYHPTAAEVEGLGLKCKEGCCKKVCACAVEVTGVLERNCVFTVTLDTCCNEENKDYCRDAQSFKTTLTRCTDKYVIRNRTSRTTAFSTQEPATTALPTTEGDTTIVSAIVSDAEHISTELSDDTAEATYIPVSFPTPLIILCHSAGPCS